MGDMSPYFSWAEVACKGPDCCNHSAAMDLRIIELLEWFRKRVGQPVYINSGFRCRKWNSTPVSEENPTAPGSDDNSQHPKGRAVDIRKVDGFTIDEMAEILMGSSVVRGLIRYENFVHVDVRDGEPYFRDYR